MRYIYLLTLLLAVACKPSSQTETSELLANPPAEGFNLENSDPKAIAIADEVMEAMGGREAWDATRYIKWNFFGSRTLTWDKQAKRVRIEIPRDSMILLANYETNTGKVSVGGVEYTQADSLTKYMERARRIWINDSYWLVMPFKLKDSGVSLGYIGTDTTLTGEAADVLSLGFEGVGVTPENKYHVWVSQEDHLVKQWAFYRNATDSIPGFVTPWDQYQTFGQIKLSGNRGERGLSEIEVFDELEESVFTDF